MSDPDTYLQARDAFRRFVAVCQELAQKVKPDNSNLRSLISPHLRPRVLAEAAEKTKEFAEFARSMFVVAPPDPTSSILIGVAALKHASSRSGTLVVNQLAALQEEAVATARKLIEECVIDADPNTLEGRISEALRQQIRHEVENFLRRTGFYQDVFEGVAIDFGALLERFRDPPTHEATILIAIDGLSVKGGDVVINATTRLRALDRDDLLEVFENRQVEPFAVAIDTRPLEGRTFLQLDLSNESDAHFYPQLERYEEPWLSYVNLFSDQTVHSGESFLKFNSMRRFPPFPADKPSPTIDQDELAAIRVVSPILECASDELEIFVAKLEQGRQRAAANGRATRLTTALGAFARACRTFDIDWYCKDPDFDEVTRTIIDFWIVTEAIFAQRNDQKKRIAERAAALLARADREEPALFDRVMEVKETRNGLVHGDEPPHYDQLIASVNDLRIWTGQSLTALLRMGGDQRRIVEGQGDRELKSRNRQLVPRYGE